MTKPTTIKATVAIDEAGDQEPVAGILSRSEALAFLGVSETTLTALIDQERLAEGSEGFALADLERLR